jgi:hypothetical protein
VTSQLSLSCSHTSVTPPTARSPVWDALAQFYSQRILPVELLRPDVDKPAALVFVVGCYAADLRFVRLTEPFLGDGVVGWLDLLDFVAHVKMLFLRGPPIELYGDLSSPSSWWFAGALGGGGATNSNPDLPAAALGGGRDRRTCGCTGQPDLAQVSTHLQPCGLVPSSPQRTGL